MVPVVISLVGTGGSGQGGSISIFGGEQVRPSQEERLKL